MAPCLAEPPRAASSAAQADRSRRTLPLCDLDAIVHHVFAEIATRQSRSPTDPSPSNAHKQLEYNKIGHMDPAGFHTTLPSFIRGGGVHP